MTVVDRISSTHAFHKHVETAHVLDVESFPDEHLNH